MIGRYLYISIQSNLCCLILFGRFVTYLIDYEAMSLDMISDVVGGNQGHGKPNFGAD